MTDRFKGNFLQVVRGLTIDRLARAKAVVSPERLREEAGRARAPRGFIEGLRAVKGVCVIAEAKRKSPSLGAIALDLDPVAIARAFASAGAAAISVLTEPDYFAGSLDDLRDVRAALPEQLLLMKDFVIEPYQLLQARASGADCVLLIQALLGERALGELMAEASDLGLDALVEVHDEDELASAVRAGAALIGVNNRNLKTLEVDLATSLRLVRRRAGPAFFLTESGLSTGSDVALLLEAGFDGFLIGAALTSGGTPGDALKDILRAGRGSR